jgi:acyl-CoA synthetase (AMP-forming)/AMP-acid ligase II
MNLGEILDRAARRFPERTAVACGDESFTYAELAARAFGLARGLRAAGLEPGDRVAIRSANCHRFLEAYFAAAAAGLVLVPVNIRLAPREVEEILADATPRLVLEDAAEHERLVRTAPDGPLSRPPGGEAPAQLYYTSGTTGTPKGVVLTHANVYTHALGAVAELALDETDVWAHVAPMYHLADAWATFAVTLVGGRHVMFPSFDPEAVLRGFRTHGVTLTNLVPTMLNAMVRMPGAGADPYPDLRLLLSGGAPIAPALVREIMATFRCEYVQTYGMTETSPYLTVSILREHLKALPEEEQFRYRASTGRPFLTATLRVVREDGSEIEPDGVEVGEILARGPSVTPGYWNNPEATARAFTDGWLHTGDLATIDGEGYLNIVDRKKDLIITGGENVYSTEVEHVLYEHPAVHEVAVIGVPDETWGEAVRAVVVRRDGAAVTAEELIEFVGERLADFKTPKSVVFVAELEKTGTGKIAKRAIREAQGR